MKKIQGVLVCLLCGLLFLIASPSFAADNGSLQLDPNVITNSDGGVGATNDFPIVNSLFTPNLNAAEKSLSKDTVSGQKAKLTFSKETKNALYTTDTSTITKKLFVNYKPQVIARTTSTKTANSTLWYWVMGLVGLFLVILAVFLGQRFGKKKLREKHG